MHIPVPDNLDCSDLHVAIAVSRYHHEITDALLRGAVDLFVRGGGRDDDLVIMESPGAFELTACCSTLLADEDLDAVVAIGCVITGETMHDQYINHAVAHGLTELAIEYMRPVCFGIVTCSTIEQARQRAGGDKGNKGAEAMAAAVSASKVIRAWQLQGGMTP